MENHQNESVTLPACLPAQYWDNNFVEVLRPNIEHTLPTRINEEQRSYEHRVLKPELLPLDRINRLISWRGFLFFRDIEGRIFPAASAMNVHIFYIVSRATGSSKIIDRVREFPETENVRPIDFIFPRQVYRHDI